MEVETKSLERIMDEICILDNFSSESTDETAKLNYQILKSIHDSPSLTPEVKYTMVNAIYKDNYHKIENKICNELRLKKKERLDLGLKSVYCAQSDYSEYSKNLPLFLTESASEPRNDFIRVPLNTMSIIHYLYNKELERLEDHDNIIPKIFRSKSN